MKLKLLFLGMLGAALLVGCNNDVIDPNGGSDDPNNPNYNGQTTYASWRVNFAGPQAATYAGDTDVASANEEKAISDAVMFIYKWDGANMDAEGIAYVKGTNLNNGTEKSITMKVIAGRKKIFMAANTGGASPIVDNDGNVETYILYPDSGKAYSTQFTAMNKILEVASNTAGFNAVSAVTWPNVESKANPLIQRLAGGADALANGTLYSTTAYTANTRFFMSNWDGPTDAGGTNFTSDCIFLLIPNITAQQSKIAPINTDNHFRIGVQRGTAKISLRITAAGNTHSSTATAPYESSEADGSKGKFTPWTMGTDHVWALGGIAKRTTPFQTFLNGAVSSPNYALSWGDSVYFTALKASFAPSYTSDAHSIRWYDSYDNTRVYGTGKKYGTSANTVTNVKNSMTTVANNASIKLSPANGNNLVFAMATENASEYPQIQSKGTYVIVGGLYLPERWIGDICRAPVSSNAANRGWNGSSANTTVFDGSQQNIYGTNYNEPTWPNTNTERDTLYYYAADKVFIWGTTNLLAYFAWVKGFGPTVGETLLPAAITSTAAAALLRANVATVDAMNAATADGQLFAYYQGQCFYRIWVMDKDATAEDMVLVRRNHIYDININKIKGPGIADPNKIINPEIIPPIETYVTADISVLDWHKVSQDATGDFE